MRVATYNVNGVNGRLPRLLAWLSETSPDIVCLQEIKTSDDRFPAPQLERAGYGAIWHGQRSHHGVAVLAKGEAPRELRRGLPGDESDVETRYLEADVKGLTVASIYLPNGNPQPGPRFSYKLAWFERLIEYAQTLATAQRTVILAGDFNVVPADFDIYNAWVWREDAVMQPETRDAYRRLLEQGWVDATRARYPRDRIYTFWTTAAAFARNAGFRMDFLLLNAEAAARLADTGVDAEYRGREGASDHAPVWISLRDIAAPRAKRSRRTQRAVP